MSWCQIASYLPYVAQMTSFLISLCPYICSLNLCVCVIRTWGPYLPRQMSIRSTSNVDLLNHTAWGRLMGTDITSSTASNGKCPIQLRERCSIHEWFIWRRPRTLLQRPVASESWTQMLPIVGASKCCYCCRRSFSGLQSPTLYC